MTALNANQKTVLIIEDEVDILFTLKEFLELEGYNVLVAENGLEALEIVKTSIALDLILLDMKMPKMNGWEFAEEYHNKYTNSSPIVVMTAAAEAKERANDVHAVGWIEKPFDLDLLLEKIKTYVKK